MDTRTQLPTLYRHPASPAGGSIEAFAAERHIALDCRVIDLFAAEQAGPGVAGFSAGQVLPVLVDGDVRVAGSAAILQYLAEQVALMP